MEIDPLSRFESSRKVVTSVPHVLLEPLLDHLKRIIGRHKILDIFDLVHNHTAPISLTKFPRFRSAREHHPDKLTRSVHEPGATVSR